MGRLNLLDLAELELPDEELVPEILPVDARLSVRGPVAKFITLFERAAALTPVKEVISGTGFALFDAVEATDAVVAHAAITASNGQQTVHVVVDGLTVLMSGSVLFPPKKILDILKTAPTEQVRLEVLGTTATLRSGRAQWTVQTPVGDSMGPLPRVDDIELHSVSKAVLMRSLAVARRAVAGTAAVRRPAMMQVLVRNGEVTGADGGRLHRQRIKNFPLDLDMTIPAGVVDEVLRSLRASASEEIEIGANERFLVFRVDSDSIIAQRLLLDFPDMENLIRGPVFTNNRTLTVERRELAEVLKRVRVNSDPDYSTVFLGLIPGPKSDSGAIRWTMAVRARDRLGNSSQEIMECSFDGPPSARELCVNHHYLSEFLACMVGDEVEFKLGDDTKTQRYPMFVENEETGFTGFVSQMNSSMIR